MYDAFISYSHAADGRLAPAVQSGLHRFAKPLLALRALRVFRDQTSLSVTPSLWSSIESALDQSRFFVLMASPMAAKSEWVRKEIEHWLEAHGSETILILLTEGELRWDPKARRFDSEASTAIPETLWDAFPDEPLYVDLRWAQSDNDLTLSNSAFRDAIAEIASTIHDRPLDEISGEDVRQQRRTRRLARAAVSGLVVLTLASLSLSWFAFLQREQAIAQRDLAEQRGDTAFSRQLAAQALGLAGTARGDLALLLSLEAIEVSETVEGLGSLLASLTSDPSLVGFLHGHVQDPTDVTFSPDGRYLASYGCEGFGDLDLCDRRGVRLWDVEKGALVNVFDALGARHRTKIGFGPDGRRLLVSSMRESPSIWDPFNGVVVAETSLANPPRASAIAWSDNQPLLAIGTSDGLVVYDVDQNAPVGPLLRHAEVGRGAEVRALDFVPGRRQLAAGTKDGMVSLWSVATNPAALSESHRVHDSDIVELDVSPDGSTVATVSWDSSVKVTELGLGGSQRVLLRDRDARDIAFSADGEKLAVAVDIGDIGGEVLIWDTRSYGAPLALPGRRPMAFQPRGSLLASTAADGVIVVRDLDKASPLERLRVVTAGIEQLVFHPVDGSVIAAGADGVVRFFDRDGGVTFEVAHNESGKTVDAIAVDTGGRRMASAGRDATIRLWSLETGGPPELLAEWKGHEGNVFGLAFSPDGMRLASGGTDQIVRIWNLKAEPFEEVRTSTEFDIYRLDFDPSGEMLAFGIEDSSLWTWHWGGGVPVRVGQHRPQTDGVTALAFTTDGRRFVSASLADTVIWSLDEPDTSFPLPATAAALSTDDRLIAMGRDDGVVVLVDMATGVSFETPLGRHASQVTAIAFAADGTSVASAASVVSGQGRADELVVWNTDVASWRRRACEIANRPLHPDERRRYLGSAEPADPCR